VVLVDQMWSDDEEVTAVGPGENVKIKLKGIEEDDVSPGFVLCDNANPIKTGRVFDAQVRETVERILIIQKYFFFFYLIRARMHHSLKAYCATLLTPLMC